MHANVGPTMYWGYSASSCGRSPSRSASLARRFFCISFVPRECGREGGQNNNMFSEQYTSTLSP